ncbi:MAG: M1 family metallopeptidase [Candidatus Aminicenantia bacterium]
MIKIKKIYLLLSVLTLLAILSNNFLSAQEIPPYHKSGIKYDYRTLILEEPEHNFDVLHYRFDWKIDFSSSFIKGKAEVRCRSFINNLNKITLHLNDNMKVDKITQNQMTLDFIHHNNQIDIYLVEPFYQNEEFTVEIRYHGYPSEGLNFSYHQSQPIIWSLDEPVSARAWFPCYDLPSDKATVELRITIPNNMIAASNGTLVNFISNSDNTVTYHWEENYPIATYLISVAATNYEVFSDYYYSQNNSMEVTYFVYPEDFHLAKKDFSVTVPMIEFYSQVFGEYPFIKEKYGMAEIPGGTAMEHQTCTSYPESLITGNHNYDWIIAHELAHQWWGDLVTLLDWADIWLNEGFATYSDALWQENLTGFNGLKNRMAEFKNIYFNRHQGPEHPIYNPPEGHLFCSIEYEKPAWVLHMLRHIVGDKNFWKILRQYAQIYAYSNASTKDFQHICEQIFGSNLDWFFNQWIYQPGYPKYQFGWYYLGQNKVRIIINQTQENFSLFIMPVDLVIKTFSGEIKKTVWVDEKYNVFDFSLEEKPIDILFDPDDWILYQVEPYQKKGKSRR